MPEQTQLNDPIAAEGWAAGMRLPLGHQPGGPYVPPLCSGGASCSYCLRDEALTRNQRWLAAFAAAQASRRQ